MMVFRRRMVLIIGGALLLVVVLVGARLLHGRGLLDYLLSWDPTPVGLHEPSDGPNGDGAVPSARPGGGEDPPDPGDAVPRSDFFVDFRLDRERTRGQQLEQLRELINNSKVDEASRQTAAQGWLALTQQIGKELEMEGLIKAKGWNDCVVLVQEASCTVVVRAPKLTQSEVARIGDIIVRGTGLAPQAITISARGS